MRLRCGRRCARLAWTGAELDKAANTRGEMRISTAESKVAVLVVPTDEEAMIARHTVESVGVGGSGADVAGQSG